MLNFLKFFIEKFNEFYFAGKKQVSRDFPYNNVLKLKELFRKWLYIIKNGLGKNATNIQDITFI